MEPFRARGTDGVNLTRATRAEAALDPPAISGWEVVRPRLLFALRSLIVCSFVAAACLVVHAAELRRRADPRHEVHVANWQWSDVPAFCDSPSLRDLPRRAGLSGRTVRLHDREAIDWLVARIEAEPEVRSVRSVRRRFPNELDIHVEFRRPRAAVAGAGEMPGFSVVDGEGVVVSTGHALRPVVEGRLLPIVTGAGGALPKPGATCADDVQAALALLDGLAMWPVTTERQHLALLDEVDVTNFTGRIDPSLPEVVLRAAPRTAAGARPTDCAVEWGRCGERRGEPSFAQKTNHVLRALVADPALATLERVLVAFADLRVVPLRPAPVWEPPLRVVARRP